MFPSESSHIWMFPVYLQFVWLSAVLEIIELIILLSLVRFSVHKYSSKNYPNPSTTKWLASVTARILTWHCPGHAAPVMIRFCPRQCKGYHGTVLDSRCYDSVQYCPRQCKGYLGAVLDSRCYDSVQYSVLSATVQRLPWRCTGQPLLWFSTVQFNFRDSAKATLALSWTAAVMSYYSTVRNSAKATLALSWTDAVMIQYSTVRDRAKAALALSWTTVLGIGKTDLALSRTF